MRQPLIVMTAILLVVAGCSGGESVEPPADSWPQPENGQITTKMCGLLTPEDYEQLNHQQLLDLEPQGGEKAATNGVTCSAPPADMLVLTLQPTAESAKLWYQGSLAAHKSAVISDKSDTVLAENLVTGADESWFDYWLDSGNDKLKDYELHVRRGALVVTLVLSGVDETREKDPKGTLIALADRVLQRVGDLGKTDTGTTPMLHLEVNGNGKAERIQYVVPDREPKTLEGVPLPWKADLPLADHGEQSQNISLSAQAPITSGIAPQMSCRILADDKVLSEEQSLGFAGCLGNLPAR